jgi:tetratricopeptide (TPR) repeat protein
MALKLNCLEHLTAIGIGVGACALAPFDAGLTAGAVIGGAGLFARIRENMRRAGLDDSAAIERMQKMILREWDHWQATEETRDAVTKADAAMTQLLPQVMMTREELAATATRSPEDAYPRAAAREIVDRLAMHDPMFAAPAASGGEPVARAFALAVVERALRAAKEDGDYAVLLTLDISIELGRAVAETLKAVEELAAKIEAGFAAVQSSLSGEFDRISVQALRGAVARFAIFRPDATTSEVVAAVEQFVPQYEELRARVEALQADDNRLRGAQQAAEQALGHGDLDAARRHLAEAAEIRIEHLAEPVRQAAATIHELARADLLALEWQSASANWSRASEMLAPFDPAASERLMAAAATSLFGHGERFAQAGAIAASIERLRSLVAAAAARGDDDLWAERHNDLGIALRAQGGGVGDEAGVALLAEAVAAFRAALTVFREAEMPVDWMMVQNNLGNALHSQGERTVGEAGQVLLAQGVDAYRSILSVHDKSLDPSDWAMTQNNLANALHTQARRTGGERGLALMTEAVEAFRAALSVYTELASPTEWATTQNNLGSALSQQGKRSSGETRPRLFAEAIGALRAALTVRTEQDMPANWAATQNNLAIALKAMGEETGGEAGVALIAEAVDAYRAALRVFTEPSAPVHWATTQNNLAVSLLKQSELTDGPDRRTPLLEAIHALSAALTVRTKEAMPAQWAVTMVNLGLCHEALAEAEDEPLDRLRVAENVLAEAAQVYTPEHMEPYHEELATILARVRARISQLEDEPVSPLRTG